MNFYWLNSNENRYEGGYRKWLAHGFGFTFGSVTPKKLEPGDLVFMYVNKKGVKAVGMVMNHWDGVAYNQPLIPQNQADHAEYRIEINWFIVLDDCVPHKEAMEILDWHTRSEAIASIECDKGEKLLRCILKKLE